MGSSKQPLSQSDTAETLKRIEEHLAAMREQSERGSRTWLTVQEAAKELQVSKDTIERLVVSGKLKAAAIVTSTGNGQRRMYRVKDEWLEEFLLSSTSPSVAQSGAASTTAIHKGT